jgi:hypothetical protein
MPGRLAGPFRAEYLGLFLRNPISGFRHFMDFVWALGYGRCRRIRIALLPIHKISCNLWFSNIGLSLHPYELLSLSTYPLTTILETHRGSNYSNLRTG